MKQLSMLFLFFSSTNTFCQDLSNVKEFFTKDNVKTDQAHASYYLTGKRKNNVVHAIDVLDSYVDTVYSFYLPSNDKKSIMVYNQKGLLNGRFILFHENGAMKEKGNYAEGKRIGCFTSWYPNGKVRHTFQYFSSPTPTIEHEIFGYKIINYFDSLGNQIITNGKGYCKCYLIQNLIMEEGRVVDGLRDSLWRGYENDSLQFEERFLKGDFISGVGYYKGNAFPYDEYEVQATYPGGMDALYKFLNMNIRYPTYARRNGVNGKVYIQFCVERDGSLSDLQIIKGVHESVDQESLRLIGLMPKWIPGKRRGVYVKSKFVLPLTFKLEL